MLIAENNSRSTCLVWFFPGTEGRKGMKIAIEADSQA